MVQRIYRVNQDDVGTCDRLRVAKLEGSFAVQLRDDSHDPDSARTANCTLKAMGAENLFVFLASDADGRSISFCEWERDVLKFIDPVSVVTGSAHSTTGER